MAETYRFVLVGNPNVGKSSLFNALTGLHQHTGNWPGKTVATAAGTCSIDGAAVELIDLPGTYSLSARSPEEEVAAEYISFGCADAVIVVCDATALERNLYLALQVMEITDHVVICVNLMDEAGKRGITVDLPRLSQLLGVRVVGTSARQKKTLPPLLRAAVAAAQERHRKPVPVRYGEAIEAGLFSIEARLDELLPGSMPNHRWIAMQLLTGGDTAIRALEKKLERPLEEDPFLSEAVRLGRERIDRAGETAAAAAAVLLRRAADIAAEVVSAAHQNSFSRDRRADRILTGKKFGIPIMLLLLLILFYLTVQGANYPSAFLSSMLFAFGDILSRWLLAAGIPLWLHDALRLLCQPVEQVCDLPFDLRGRRLGADALECLLCRCSLRQALFCLPFCRRCFEQLYVNYFGIAIRTDVLSILQNPSDHIFVPALALVIDGAGFAHLLCNLLERRAE